MARVAGLPKERRRRKPWLSRHAPLHPGASFPPPARRAAHRPSPLKRCLQHLGGLGQAPLPAAASRGQVIAGRVGAVPGRVADAALLISCVAAAVYAAAAVRPLLCSSHSQGRNNRVALPLRRSIGDHAVAQKQALGARVRKTPARLARRYRT
jgi:hypothetical protein